MHFHLRSSGWRFPTPSAHTRTCTPPLTHSGPEQQDALAAVAQGISGHALVGAPVMGWVGTLDTQAQLGPLRVQHESQSARLHLPLLRSQPEELGGWHAPKEGTSQPGLIPPRTDTRGPATAS